MVVRGKFRLSAITRVAYNPQAVLVKLEAVLDDGIEENARFAKATPSGSVTMQIDNQSAANQFSGLGQYFYVDFTPCVETQEEGLKQGKQ